MTLIDMLRALPGRLTALIRPLSIAFIVVSIAGVIAILTLGTIAHWADPQKQRTALSVQLAQAQSDLAQLRATSETALADLTRLRADQERAQALLTALLDLGRDRPRQAGLLMQEVSTVCRGRDAVAACAQQELTARLSGR